MGWGYGMGARKSAGFGDIYESAFNDILASHASILPSEYIHDMKLEIVNILYYASC
jgi:hypothetical protein